MTKHEYHIALVLIALITAGVLGHQWLNAETYRTSQDCTPALYFSGSDGCRSSDAINIQPSPFSNEQLQDAIAPEEIGMFEKDYYMLDDTSNRRTGFSNRVYTSKIRFERSSIRRVNPQRELPQVQFAHITFLVSDDHGEIIKQLTMHK